jgi:hypothetical protein
MITAAATCALAACSKLPGKSSVPSTGSLPSAPGGLGGASGEVDPNTCGNYAATDAGVRLKAFLQATKDLQTTTTETLKVVKQSCIMMGKDLGMSDTDLGGDDTKAICDKVFQAYKDNLKVAFKAHAKLAIHYVPAKCTVDASASASASAGCSGAAAAGAGGAEAAGQCKASGQVEAAVHAQCTEPKFTIEASAKFILDKTKAEETLKAARDGLPQLLSVAARIKPIQDAAATWAQTAKDLADMGPKFAQSFKDQAMCIAGQIGAAANAAASIQVNVSVSVSVSAEASGSAEAG